MALITDAAFDLDALDATREKLRLDWDDLAATPGADQSTLYRSRRRESAPRPVYRSRLQLVAERHCHVNRGTSRDRRVSGPRSRLGGRNPRGTSGAELHTTKTLVGCALT